MLPWAGPIKELDDSSCSPSDHLRVQSQLGSGFPERVELEAAPHACCPPPCSPWIRSVCSHSVHAGRSSRRESLRRGTLLGALVGLATRPAVSRPRALYARAEVWARLYALLRTARVTLSLEIRVLYA
jgi:hypothetical protein